MRRSNITASPLTSASEDILNSKRLDGIIAQASFDHLPAEATPRTLVGGSGNKLAVLADEIFIRQGDIFTVVGIHIADDLTSDIVFL